MWRHISQNPLPSSSHIVTNVWPPPPSAWRHLWTAPYDDFKLIRITCQAACHGKTEHGIPVFVKFKKPSKTAGFMRCEAPMAVRLGDNSLNFAKAHLTLALAASSTPPPLLPQVCRPTAELGNTFKDSNLETFHMKLNKFCNSHPPNSVEGVEICSSPSCILLMFGPISIARV